MVGPEPATASPSLVRSPVRRPHGSCAAPVNARTVSGASIGGGARLPSVVAARSATCRRVNRSGHWRTREKSLPRSNRIRPAADRCPPSRGREAEVAEGARTSPDLSRGDAIDSVQRQRQRNRAGRVPPPLQDRSRHHQHHRVARHAPEPPAGHRQRLRLSRRLLRSQDPPRPQTVPVQSQARARGPARHLTRRAPLRPNLLGRRRIRQPPLDVQLALYDSSGAPVSFRGDLPGATMGTVLAHRSPSLFSRQDHPAPPPPPSGPRTTSRPLRRSKRPT